MINLVAELEMDHVLSGDEARRIEEHATNFFGGETRSYVELEHVEGKIYDLIVKIKPPQHN